MIKQNEIISRPLITIEEKNIDNFDHIPDSLLDVLLENEFTYLLQSSLEIYYERIQRYISQYSFRYAESIANRTKLIFLRTNSIEIKKLCVQITLVSSVDLNRFAAMSTFDSLLLSIQSDEDTYSVAEGLEEIDSYKTLYDRIP